MFPFFYEHGAFYYKTITKSKSFYSVYDLRYLSIVITYDNIDEPYIFKNTWMKYNIQMVINLGEIHT